MAGEICGTYPNIPQHTPTYPNISWEILKSKRFIFLRSPWGRSEVFFLGRGGGKRGGSSGSAVQAH